MWPLVFSIPARPLFIVLAMGIAAVIAGRLARKHEAGTSLATLWLLLVAADVVGLIGAKLDSLIERDSGLQPLLWELQQGYRYPGGVIAVLLVVPVLARALGVGRSILALGDLLAPTAGFAMVVVRVGCFLAGCCHGSVSGLPWALSFPSGTFAWTTQVNTRMIRADVPASLPVHPLQLYFALWSLALAVFLLWLLPRRAYEGQVLLVYLALDNLVKCLFEFLRDPFVPHLQWLSLAIGLAAAGVLLTGWLHRWAIAPMASSARLPAGH